MCAYVIIKVEAAGQKCGKWKTILLTSEASDIWEKCLAARFIKMLRKAVMMNKVFDSVYAKQD